MSQNFTKNDNYFATIQPQNKAPAPFNTYEHDPSTSQIQNDLTKSCAPVVESSTYYVDYTYQDFGPPQGEPVDP